MSLPKTTIEGEIMPFVNCPKCNKHELIYYPNEEKMKCPDINCGYVINLHHKETPAERQRKLSFFEELIKIGD